ncbi:hypothetical protein IMCC21906_01881 [Spongiibacter sp. IMCC21906]|nr:hypothetical protein IMCC21906_01881 [Spongiibacter sp. IMCC21906]
MGAQKGDEGEQLTIAPFPKEVASYHYHTHANDEPKNQVLGECRHGGTFIAISLMRFDKQ